MFQWMGRISQTITGIKARVSPSLLKQRGANIMNNNREKNINYYICINLVNRS